MPDRATVNRLIANAARRHPGPLGLRRKGRSLTWYDDRGWWLIDVGFDPARPLGTSLNIGVMWLWNDLDFLYYGNGGSVYWRDDGTFATEVPFGQTGRNTFASFIREHLFAKEIELVADVARRRVEQVRQQFTDPCAATAALAGRPTGASLRHAYDTGAAAALCGDVHAARRAFAEIASFAVDDLDDRTRMLRQWAADLTAVDDPAELRRLGPCRLPTPPG